MFRGWSFIGQIWDIFLWLYILSGVLHLSFGFAVQLMTLTEKHWVAWLFYAAKEWRGWFHVRAEELISIEFKWGWVQRISSPLVSSAEWRKPNDKCKCCF